jgi:hypothetical protein
MRSPEVIGLEYLAKTEEIKFQRSSFAWGDLLIQGCCTIGISSRLLEFSLTYLVVKHLLLLFCRIYPDRRPNKETNKAVQQKTTELKNALASTFAAVAIGSSVLANPLSADASETYQNAFPFSSSNVIAEKVVRQGLYSEYEVEINQEVDDARSTFKSAKETKSKKGTYKKISK